MKKGQDIEKLFRDTLQNHEVDPGANAWNAVKSQIPGAESLTAAGKASAALSSWSSTIIVGLAISGLTVGGYFFFNQKAEQQLSKVEQAPTETIESTELVDAPKNDDDQEENTLQVNPVQNEPNGVKETSQWDNAVKSNENVVSNVTIEPSVTELPTQKEEIKSIDEDLKTNNDIVSSQTETEQEITSVSESSEVPQNDSSLDNEIPTESASNGSELSNQKDSDPILEEEKDLTTAKEEKAPYVEVPNIITPNHDGTNDAFSITKSETEELHVQIYSRTNRLIHEWKGIHGFWEGDLRDGSPAPTGTYYYIIIINQDGKSYPKKGTFLLNR